MPEYSEKDIKIVAKSVLEYLAFFDNSDTSDYGYWCLFCGAGDKEGYSICGTEENPKEKIVHLTDCPVLVAQDLLTEA